MRKKALLNNNQLLTVLMLFPLDSFPDLTCEKVADLLRVSPSHLSRSFSLAGTGTLEKSLQRIRILRGAIVLSDTPGISVRDTAVKVGYEDAKHFSRLFKEILGIFPKEYMRFLETFRNSGNH